MRRGVELDRLGSGDVQDGPVSGAGQADVGRFAIQPCRADDVDVIDGQALGLVDGHGVAVLEVASSQEVHVKLGVVGAPGDAHREAGRLVVDGGHCAHGAVVDAGRHTVRPGGGVVSGAQDPVTDLEGGLTEHEGWPGETALSAAAVVRAGSRPTPRRECRRAGHCRPH